MQPLRGCGPTAWAWGDVAGRRLDGSVGLVRRRAECALTLLNTKSSASLEAAQARLRAPVYPEQRGVGLCLYVLLFPWSAENTGFGISYPEFATCCSQLCPGCVTSDRSPFQVSVSPSAHWDENR